ncbi:putative lipoprotein [Leptospira kirschneri serovar Mozdok]|nr:putative lipoprotein [Leptospira kirschneri serovar Mozdok]
MAKVLTKQTGKSIVIYGNQTFETGILSAASEMGAQILLVGQTQVTNAGEIENSELKSYQAVIRFKIYDVNTKRIIAADNTSGAVLHVNPNTGAQEAIQKAVEKIYPKIREQISTKWKPGNLILLKIEGVSYDDYVDKDIKGLIRGIKGVNSVSEVNVNQPIVLEIEALYNGNNLYQKMRERKIDFGFDFSQKEIKSSLIHIIKK